MHSMRIVFSFLSVLIVGSFAQADVVVAKFDGGSVKLEELKEFQKMVLSNCKKRRLTKFLRP